MSLEEAKAAEGEFLKARKENTCHSLDLTGYVGTYRDQWYGDVYIEKAEEGKLECN